MPVNPGALDRLITIQRPTFTRNASGERIATWATLTQVWARKIWRGGDEVFSAGQERAVRQLLFRIGPHPDVTIGTDERSRIIDGDIIYGIRAIQELGRGEGFDIYVNSLE